MEPRFSGPYFNEFVTASSSQSPDDINRRLLDRRIIGGLPLGRFYPELAGSMLLCATEMNRKADMDVVAEAFAA